MRIAHLADLHLGRVFHGISLLDDQRHVLDQVIALLRDERVDVLVLAGDLYDRALPSADAVRLFDETLRRVNDLDVPVIAIAGNHDSADHLGFGAWLFARGDVYVRGRIDADALPITLDDDAGEVTFYPLPYVEPESARALLATPDDEAVSHRTVTRALLDRARAHREAHGVERAVVVAHAFVQGDRPPEESKRSERSLHLGGVGAVPASDFEGFQYVALGHLHRPQTLGSAGRVRYSGSMMKYSFEEATHEKGLTLVDLDARGAVTISHRTLQPKRDLAVIAGTLDELLKDPSLAAVEGCFVSATLRDHPPPLQAMERLRARFPHAAELHFERPAVTVDVAALAGAEAARREPEDVFMERFLSAPPDEAERALFRDALARARAAEEARG